MEATTTRPTTPPPVTQTSQTTLPQTIPTNPNIAQLATKFIPFELGDEKELSNQQQALNGKIEVSEDQNTLIGIFFNDQNLLQQMGANDKSMICLAGLTTFLKNASDMGKVSVTINSLEEAVSFFYCGITPQEMQDPTLQNLKGIEGISLTDENHNQMKQLKYPQVGTWLSKGCQEFWKNLQNKPASDESIAKQAFALYTFQLGGSLQNTSIRDVEIEKQILSKPVRKFQISSGSHSAIMTIEVSQKEDHLVLMFKDLLIGTQPVIDSSLQPMEKFQLYQAALMRFCQYADRFPLPKDKKESEQLYAENVLFHPIIITSSRKLMDILWRLGFAPENMLKKVGEAYSDTITKMNPQRERALEEIIQKMKQAAENPSTAQKNLSEIQKLMDSDTEQEFEKLRREPPSQQLAHKATMLLNKIAAKQTPTQLDDELLSKLNIQVNKALDSCATNNPITLIFYPDFMPWYMIKAEDKDLNETVRKEFEMFVRSYELELGAAPQKNGKTEKMMDDLD